MKQDRDDVTDEAPEIIEAEPVEHPVPAPTPGPRGFQKGNKLGGRPLGVRNLLSDKVLKEYYKIFDELGGDVIRRVANEDPSTFLKIAVSLMPKEIVGKDGGPIEVSVDVSAKMADFFAKIDAIAARQAELQALSAPDEPDDDPDEKK